MCMAANRYSSLYECHSFARFSQIGMFRYINEEFPLYGENEGRLIAVHEPGQIR